MGRGASPRAAYAAFAVFGAFWGMWGASIPALRAQAGVSDGELGTALLFVGAGALPAMLLAGRLVDRWGGRATGSLLVVLAGAGVLVAGAAHDLLSLSAALAGLGAASGAADVAINSTAGSAQRATGRPVLSRAHATFSAGVVVASLLTGAGRALGALLVVPFAVLVPLAAAAAALLAQSEPPRAPPPRRRPSSRPPRELRLAPLARLGILRPRARRSPRAPRELRLAPLAGLGVLGALAFAVENGHQSFSALYLHDVLHAPPATAAAGPALFAAVVAVARLASGALGAQRPTALLLAGALTAAAGTTLVGLASGLLVGLAGLAVAGAGTAVLFPTLVGVLTRRVGDGARGRATSIVTAVAYLGFLAGPPYIGRWADAVGLPGAMLALAALAGLLAVLVAVSSRRLTSGRSAWAYEAPAPDRAC